MMISRENGASVSVVVYHKSCAGLWALHTSTCLCKWPLCTGPEHCSLTGTSWDADCTPSRVRFTRGVVAKDCKEVCEEML